MQSVRHRIRTVGIDTQTLDHFERLLGLIGGRVERPLRTVFPVIGASVYQFGHGSTCSMLRTECESFALLNLVPIHYSCGVRLARNEAESGDVLNLIEDSERIWIRVCVRLFLLAF